MTQDEIQKAFENRWRVKAHLDGTGHIKGAVIPFVSSEHQEEILPHLKSLCRDFFEAGILIANGSVCGGCAATTPSEVTVPESSVKVICHDFDYWWNLYQKKRGKEKCMKKWAKLSQKDKQACIAATPAYVASTPDVTYRKDPYTYLNNKAWNDEIIPRNNATNKPSIEQQRLDKLADLLNA